ncbi:hypothetical protein RIF29_18341 [Crotalaria pallida]|uniref:Uncharacterized protein n=1 Tax=Crotalaria pallida TaxID=3830 RepID=A0AAN9FJQ1_CROPI
MSKKEKKNVGVSSRVIEKEKKGSSSSFHPYGRGRMVNGSHSNPKGKVMAPNTYTYTLAYPPRRTLALSPLPLPLPPKRWWPPYPSRSQIQPHTPPHPPT